MTLTIDLKRRIEKILTTPSQSPTIAPSGDHTDGSWAITDLYSGELCFNTSDHIAYFRSGATIVSLVDTVVLNSAALNIHCLDLDVDNDIIANSELHFIDSTVSISRNIYDDLTFEDPNAGILTLSDLIPPSGEVTIGTGGNYPTINSAITAEKYKMILISNVTEGADITLVEKTEINLNGFDLDMGNYRLLNASYQLFIYNGEITFAHTTAVPLFSSTEIDVRNTTINNNSTIAGAYISQYGTFRNIICNLPNSNNCGFGGLSPLSFYGNIYDSEIIGGGTRCCDIIHDAVGSNSGSKVDGLKLSGVFKTRSFILYNLAGFFKNVKYTSATGGIFLISSCDGLTDASGNITIHLYGSTGGATTGLRNSVVGQVISHANGFIEKTIIINATIILYGSNQNSVIYRNCRFNSNVSIITTTSRDIILDGCIIIGTTTLNCDYVKFNNNICTGTVTLSSGAGYNVLIGNTFTGGLTDNSGETTNEIFANVE